jgi:hypothetical protein
MLDDIEKELLKRQICDEVREDLKDEREVSDRRYAIKLIENIVFALVGLLCAGVIGALIKVVLIK